MPGNREEDFERNNAFPLHNLEGHAPAQEPLPRILKIYNFGRPFLGHHYFTLSLYGPCTRVKKKIFKEIPHFYTFYPNLAPLRWGS